MSRAPASTETRRFVGTTPRCAHVDAEGTRCRGRGMFGFDIAEATLAPSSHEKWTCVPHRAWGERYWRTINGKAEEA